MKSKKQIHSKSKSKKQSRYKKQKQTKSVTKPVVLYSSKTPNSEEILEEINDKNSKTTIYKSESKIPPTIITKSDGNVIMSMHQKRNMVIRSYH